MTMQRAEGKNLGTRLTKGPELATMALNHGSGCQQLRPDLTTAEQVRMLAGPAYDPIMNLLDQDIPILESSVEATTRIVGTIADPTLQTLETIAHPTLQTLETNADPTLQILGTSADATTQILEMIADATTRILVVPVDAMSQTLELSVETLTHHPHGLRKEHQNRTSALLEILHNSRPLALKGISDVVKNSW